MDKYWNDNGRWVLKNTQNKVSNKKVGKDYVSPFWGIRTNTQYKEWEAERSDQCVLPRHMAE